MQKIHICLGWISTYHDDAAILLPSRFPKNNTTNAKAIDPANPDARSLNYIKLKSYKVSTLQTAPFSFFSE